MCMYSLSVCMPMHYMHAVPTEAKTGAQIPKKLAFWIVVSDCVGGPWEEQPVL